MHLGDIVNGRQRKCSCNARTNAFGSSSTFWTVYTTWLIEISKQLYWHLHTSNVTNTMKIWKPLMAALSYRCGHHIFVLWFLLSIFFFFSLAYSQLLQIGCLPYFHTWCGLSANLGCMSEMCCMRLAENTGCKKSPKIRHLRTIAQLCRAISSQLRHVSTIGKKNLLNSNISPMSSQYGELRPTSGWDRFGCLGHPSKFQRVLGLGFVNAAMSLNGSQPNFAGCLVISWAGILYIHFRRFLPRRRFVRCKIHFVSKSCILLYWQHQCTALQQQASAKLCGVEKRVPPIFSRAAITLGVGPHSSVISFITCIVNGGSHSCSTLTAAT